METVVSVLEEITHSDLDIYITGDFNFGPGESNEFDRYLDKHDLVQLVNGPTHREGRTLDHLYVKKSMEEKTSVRICYPYYTDHFSLCIKFK